MLKDDGMTRKLVGRFGRRGVILVALGIMWLVIGYELATSPVQRFSQPDGPLALFDAITTPWLGLVWMLGGAGAVVCGLLRSRLLRDDYGFLGLTVPVFAWTALWASSWVVFVTTGGEYGKPNAWIGTVVYTTVLGLVLFIARWPDPDDPHLTTNRRSP